MADGAIPSKEFNEQIKRTVRENLRRERGQRPRQGRWHKKGRSGTGTGGTTTSLPCGCDFLSEGTVDCLGTADSASVYVVDDLGPLGVNIELTYDTSCEWISEDIDYDCSGS